MTPHASTASTRSLTTASRLGRGLAALALPAMVQAASATVNPNLPAMFIHVFNRIAPAVSRSQVLNDVFNFGKETHQALLANDPQGVQKAQQWVQKFAALF